MNLQCPARLFIARHGDADYVETWFSDEGGWLSSEGRVQAADLGRALAHERIAQVWSSDVARAAQTAEVAARHLGLETPIPVMTRKSLREIDIGDLLGQPFDVARLHAVTDRWFAGDPSVAFPGGESGDDVVERYRDVLGEIADRHRGEAVLVVGHQLATAYALTAMTGEPVPRLANGAFLEVEYDEDWRLINRPS